MLISEQFLQRTNIVAFRIMEAQVQKFYDYHLIQVGQPTEDKTWSNVIDHNVTVAKRVAVICDMVNLAWFKDYAIIGALLHDACKRQEMESIRGAGKTWEAFDNAYRRSTEMLTQAGFDPDIIVLADSVGHDSLLPPTHTKSFLTVQDVLNLKGTEMDDALDTARLIIHYVDDFTRGTDPVTPARQGKNDFDRRMDGNEANPNYRILNEQGRNYFFGQTSYGAQRFVGKRVEALLARLVSDHSGGKVEAIDLPELVHLKVMKVEAA